MHPIKTPRILLTLLLILGVFSSFVLSSVQADTSSSITLSPAITAKLDAFIVKVQALRPRYNSDADWNTFLMNLNSKVNALKPQYTGNTLILAVLDQLWLKIGGLKVSIINTTVDTSSDAMNRCIIEDIKYNEPGTTHHRTLNNGQCRSFRFTTDDKAKQWGFETAMSTIWGTVYRFMTISEKSGDFQYSFLDNHCAASGSYAASLLYSIGQDIVWSCRLKENTTYYLNVRNENPSLGDSRHANTRGQDTCPVGATCGFVQGFN